MFYKCTVPEVDGVHKNSQPCVGNQPLGTHWLTQSKFQFHQLCSQEVPYRDESFFFHKHIFVYFKGSVAESKGKMEREVVHSANCHKDGSEAGLKCLNHQVLPSQTQDQGTELEVELPGLETVLLYWMLTLKAAI